MDSIHTSSTTQEEGGHAKLYEECRIREFLRLGWNLERKTAGSRSLTDDSRPLA
jgi:hypothetical protein